MAATAKLAPSKEASAAALAARFEQVSATAEKGDAQAMFDLGMMYEKGQGVSRDREMATQWLRNAGDMGHKGAPAALDRLLKGGSHRSELFPGASPELHTYFLKARAADGIADPLQRCLKFPDMPGNRWPSGLARAYCMEIFGPQITLAQVSALLDRGAYAKVDALYRRDLQRHFSKNDFSEVIHKNFDQFDHGASAGELSKRWLAAAPNSAFANLAHGMHLLHKARRARGDEVYKDVPAARRVEMKLLSDASLVLIGKALQLEASLLPAHVATHELIRMNGSAELAEQAFQLGRMLDPGCRPLAREHMMSLQPRWGGSYEEMAAYGAELGKLVKARPLLAMTIVSVQDDYASALDDDNAALAIRAPLAKMVPQANLFSHMGVHFADRKMGADGDALAHLLTAYRVTGERDFDTLRYLGNQLASFGDGDWAHKVLQAAVKIRPQNPDMLHMLATSYMQLQRYDEALPLLIEGLKGSPYWRRDVLRRLVELKTATGEAAAAEQYVLMWTSDYPKDMPGWYAGAGLARASNDPAKVRALWTRFLKVADRNDPHLTASIASAEKLLREGPGKPVGTSIGAQQIKPQH